MAVEVYPGVDLPRVLSFSRFHTVLPIKLRKGTLQELAAFIGEEPQRDSNRQLRYLLTGGLAVDLQTHSQRPHNDIDIVLMRWRDIRLLFRGTDNVRPRRYWAGMKFDSSFLTETASLTSFTLGGENVVVETVNPAVILVQKLSNTFGFPPRLKDIHDAVLLLQNVDFDGNSTKVVEYSMETLPFEDIIVTNQRLGELRTLVQKLPEPPEDEIYVLYQRFNHLSEEEKRRRKNSY